MPIRHAAALALLVCACAAIPARAQSKAAELKTPTSASNIGTLPSQAGYVSDIGLTGIAVGRVDGLSGNPVAARWLASGDGQTIQNFSAGSAFAINGGRQIAALADRNLYVLTSQGASPGSTEFWSSRLVKAKATPDGTHRVISGDLNDAGQIIYSSFDLWENFFIDADGTETPISGLARLLNNRGEFLYDTAVGRVQGGVFATTPIVTPAGLVSTSARGLNDAGTVVGYTYAGSVATDTVRPFTYANGTMSTLALPAGATAGAAMSINNEGNAVGWFQNAAGQRDAVLWDDGTPIPLRTFLPSDFAVGATRFTAERVTDTGYVLAVVRTVGVDKYWTILIPQAGTYGRGDADFDAGVDFDDVRILAAAYNKANAAKAVNVGDLNLDGVTDYADLLALVGSYGTTPLTAQQRTLVGATFATAFAQAQSTLPEPTTLATLGVVLATLGRRRR